MYFIVWWIFFYYELFENIRAQRFAFIFFIFSDDFCSNRQRFVRINVIAHSPISETIWKRVLLFYFRSRHCGHLHFIHRFNFCPRLLFEVWMPWTTLAEVGYHLADHIWIACKQNLFSIENDNYDKTFISRILLIKHYLINSSWKFLIKFTISTFPGSF